MRKRVVSHFDSGTVTLNTKYDQIITTYPILGGIIRLTEKTAIWKPILDQYFASVRIKLVNWCDSTWETWIWGWSVWFICMCHILFCRWPASSGFSSTPSRNGHITEMGLILALDVPRTWFCEFLALIEHFESISGLKSLIHPKRSYDIVNIQKNIIFENLNFWKFKKPLTVILTANF